MSKPIEHIGTVIALNGDKALIRFTQMTSCAACHARSMCMSAESKEKEVWAYMSDEMQVGDTVMVQVAERLAWKALALAYGLPLVLMLAAICILKIWLSEAVAGTISLVALSLYYIGLSMFRDKLDRDFDFTAKKY